MAKVKTRIIEEPQRIQLREKLINESRKRIKRGASLEDVIGQLHDEGLSIVESIWVLKNVSDHSLSELKNLVTTHPIWEKVVQDTEPLHDELEKAASKPWTQRKNRARSSR
jgi:hypothetical protein